jgi:hypothetical protein
MKQDIPQAVTTSLTNYLKFNNTIKQQSLTLLKQYQPFMDAISTEIGQRLLADLTDMHAKALQKITSLETADNDKIEYKVLTELIKRWSSYIGAYENAKNELFNDIH